MPRLIPLSEEVKSLLQYPPYWEKDHNLWDVLDWDMFFISKFPFGTIQQSHSALSSELELIIKKIPKGCRNRKALSILKCIKLQIEGMVLRPATAVGFRVFLRSTWMGKKNVAAQVLEKNRPLHAPVALYWSCLVTLCDCGRATFVAKGNTAACPKWERGDDRLVNFWQTHSRKLANLAIDNRISEELITNAAMSATASKARKLYNQSKNREDPLVASSSKRKLADSVDEVLSECESLDLESADAKGVQFDEPTEARLDSMSEKTDQSFIDENDIAEFENVTRLNSEEHQASSGDDIDWEDIKSRIDKYRETIKQDKKLYNPLYYYIIDHSKQHIPTNELLQTELPKIGRQLSVDFNIQDNALSEDEGEFLDQLLDSDDLETIKLRKPSDKEIKNLVRTLKENHARRRGCLSEIHHTIRTLIPFVDATMDLPGPRPYQVEWGEHVLQACTERRNENRDPQLNSRVGLKCDCRIVCTTASWKAEIGVGEVSGGLPECNHVKSWEDKVKLAIELRDMLMHIRRRLNIEVPVFGWQLRGFRLKLYAMSSLKGFFHMQLIHEIDLPSGEDDLYLVEDGVQAFRSFNLKMEETAKHIRELVRTKIKFQRKQRASVLNPRVQRCVTPPLSGQLPIVATPAPKKQRKNGEVADDIGLN
ncbi:4206_t:CDS:10 [Paraglomus brasilianum]|uniref:4206_t:CDS:1 n=1 Tax=Paraglomus brasilianum TaxID=144538 RepID=A0A9N9BIX8_9GLOM|nr:4206_t:CDS:10 [Paraglomus brasilianum]